MALANSLYVYAPSIHATVIFLVRCFPCPGWDQCPLALSRVVGLQCRRELFRRWLAFPPRIDCARAVPRPWPRSSLWVVREGARRRSSDALRSLNSSGGASVSAFRVAVPFACRLARLPPLGGCHLRLCDLAAVPRVVQSGAIPHRRLQPNLQQQRVGPGAVRCVMLGDQLLAAAPHRRFVPASSPCGRGAPATYWYCDS